MRGQSERLSPFLMCMKKGVVFHNKPPFHKLNVVPRNGVTLLSWCKGTNKNRNLQQIMVFSFL